MFSYSEGGKSNSEYYDKLCDELNGDKYLGIPPGHSLVVVPYAMAVPVPNKFSELSFSDGMEHHNEASPVNVDININIDPCPQ